MTEHVDSQSHYHHGNLRAALIAAGREILEEGGPRALTMREAARRADVSHAAPRHHFASLQEFFAECAADGFREFADCLAQGAPGDGDPAAGIAKMGRAYLGFAANNRAMFRIMFDRDSFTHSTPALVAASRRSYVLLVEAVARFEDVPPDELNYRVGTIWAIVHGYASLMLEDQIAITAGSAITPMDMAERALKDYLTGIAHNRAG